MINLGTLSYKHSELMFIAYFSLLGLFYNFGNTLFLPKQQKLNNSYTLIGSLGTISMLLALSFDWFWKELSNFKFSFSSLISSPEFIASIILSILAAVLWYLSAIKNKSFRLDKNPISIIFALFIGLFIIGLSSMPLALIATNLLIFILGLLSIRNGIQQQHLGLLNYGLLTISALIACRFFDTNLTFTARGILFISIGLGFFGANYWLLKNKTTHE